jgi:hypothetical protein
MQLPIVGFGPIRYQNSSHSSDLLKAPIGITCNCFICVLENVGLDILRDWVDHFRVDPAPDFAFRGSANDLPITVSFPSTSEHLLF